jgi:hypothetical protein
MKKTIRKMLYCVTTVVFIVGLCVLYYYYPRSISFELTKEIDEPNLDFDISYWLSYDYVPNEERLMFWMVKKYQYPYSRADEQGYDSIFVQNLSKELDFKKYDYIITYQKQLKELRHSPYLTKTEDGLYFDKKTPLIPTFDTEITDKVYIYQIKKNNKYRALGP